MVEKSNTASTQAFDGNATIKALRKFKKPSQLWRGYTALAARNLPFTAMQFPMFEHLRTSILAYRKRNSTFSGSLLEKGIVTAISAGTAGSVAAVVTTPIDVVKTRIMLSAASDGDAQSEAKRQALKQFESQGKDVKAEIERVNQAMKGGRAGGLAIGKEITKAEGIKGLFRGGALRAVWTALGSGLYLGVYESGRSYLEGRRIDKPDGQSTE